MNAEQPTDGSQLAGMKADEGFAKVKPLSLFVFLPFWLYLSLACDWSDVDPLLKPSFDLLFSPMNKVLTTVMLLIMCILPPGWPSFRQAAALVLSCYSFLLFSVVSTERISLLFPEPTIYALAWGVMCGGLGAVGVATLIERLWPDSIGPDGQEP